MPHTSDHDSAIPSVTETLRIQRREQRDRDQGATRRQWLTSTTVHDDGTTNQYIYPPETAEQYVGMARRLREAGREFTSGPGWIEYDSQHQALGVSWTSRTRLEWTDEAPTADLGDVDPLASLDRSRTTQPGTDSPRWTVTGPLGSIVYDLLGNHLAVLNPAGDVIDSLCKRYAVEARDASGDDDAVFALLADHYWTQLIVGGA